MEAASAVPPSRPTTIRPARRPWQPVPDRVQLESERGKPRNPFINAGALCVADHLLSAHTEPLRAFADLGLRLHGECFSFDDEVARSERETGFRNAALVNFIKSFGQIDNDVETVLGLYCHQCAIVVGVPCKSRVGGAIVAVVPGEMVLCAWSPGLGETGNSVAARRALELFVTRAGLSVF